MIFLIDPLLAVTIWRRHKRNRTRSFKKTHREGCARSTWWLVLERTRIFRKVFLSFFFLFHSFFVSFLPPVLVIMRMWQAYEYRYCPPYRSLANPRRRSGPRKGNCSSEKTSALSKEHRQIGQGSLSSGSNFRVGWRPSAIIDDKRRTLSSSPLFVEEDRPVFVSLYRRIEFWYGSEHRVVENGFF